ncbi:MAG TPA: 2-dehydropantoate 2-reductase [Anaerolineales bacterium]|nr:2-dehydropantoate 2-reductase [Anaerolineales bacterium]
MLIAGTGALACLFAARLSAAGVEVAMLGSWPAGLEALRAHGVRVIDAVKGEQAYPVQVIRRGEKGPETGEALVLVKAWQTAQAAHDLKPRLASGGLALSLQNGLGNDKILAASLGWERVAVGVTTTGATLIAPGVVRQAGVGPISLARQPGSERLTDQLIQAGFGVHYEESVDSLVWGKLAINAAINPLTALLDIPNGGVLDIPAARELAHALVREATAVALALGIEPPYLDPVAALEQVAEQTADNFSSMLQDLRRGAPTEIDAINGAIVQAGVQAQIPTPVNATLWRLVRARVQKNL